MTRELRDIQDLWFLAELIIDKNLCKVSNLSSSGGGLSDSPSSQCEWAWSYRKYATDKQEIMFREDRAPGYVWKLFGERIPDHVFDKGVALLKILY